MSDLAPAPAFGGMQEVGTGKGITVRLRHISLVSVLARRNAGAALADKAQTEFALTLPPGPQRYVAGGMSVLGIGPARWIFLRAGLAPNFAAELSAALGEFASISDHSDGYALFELSGLQVRHLLAKGVPLDLDPAVFAETDVAVTSIAHIGAIIWRCNGCFIIAVFRSYAGSFWHWLAASAAEFGLEILESQ